MHSLYHSKSPCYARQHIGISAMSRSGPASSTQPATCRGLLTTWLLSLPPEPLFCLLMLMLFCLLTDLLFCLLTDLLFCLLTDLLFCLLTEILFCLLTFLLFCLLTSLLDFLLTSLLDFLLLAVECLLLALLGVGLGTFRLRLLAALLAPSLTESLEPLRAPANISVKSVQ